MLELDIDQGLAKNWVLQAVNEDGSDAVSFLTTDTLVANVWAGEDQAPIFSPTATWFDGLASITLTAGGTAYSQFPVITFSGGGSTNPASAIATVVGGVITNLILTDPGTGYTSNPTVVISDGTGTAATATAVADIGWQYGHVALSISADESALLVDANTSYRVNIVGTRLGTPVGVGDLLLAVKYSPGTATQVTLPYCTLQDMLSKAPWLRMIQDPDSDQGSYYDQRLEATQWLNCLIVRSYRGTSSSYFGDSSRSAQYWSGSAGRRSPLPSQWLINMLSGGIVINPITVTAAGSGYVSPVITFTGGGAPAAGAATASAVVAGGQIISITLVNTGYGYTSAPTITITDATGTGATATCQITQHTLILRPQIVRLVAMKAVSLVALGQIGKSNSIANYGAMFRDMASAELSGVVAEIDLTGNGIADFPVPLGVTNTMFS